MFWSLSWQYKHNIYFDNSLVVIIHSTIYSYLYLVRILILKKSYKKLQITNTKAQLQNDLFHDMKLGMHINLTTFNNLISSTRLSCISIFIQILHNK